ncbi:hypothetical protein Clacol_010426 [Clathrus columnatus]|uniref:Uncharacterized protein n=1 Tax=Clathrus columnatus TaxID=1419009 RepID=A0AAV5AV01_9AGAM|nr:hypothetical protein Clacol_010426 [Clathrus columnatus]
MFSFNVTIQNTSTNSSSSSSYTFRFRYQPLIDSDMDDQAPTHSTTPLPSSIEDLETEPQYLLMSKDVSTRTSLGFTFKHIGFDVPYECVQPYSSLPYHSRYIFIPIEELFLMPPCLYPEEYLYSFFPAPTPLPMPPINKVLRKIRSYAIEMFKGKNQSLAEEKHLEEGLRKFQNHSVVGW